MTNQKEGRFVVLAGIVVMTILIVLFGNALSWSAAIQIKFIDSVNVEEAYLITTSATTNNGRVTSGGANRVIHYAGRNYANYWNFVMRFPTFKDSTDNYAGLVIDSFKIVNKIETTSYDVNDDAYMLAVGIDTNMNWVEGNRSGAEAQDCEVSWDSAQQVGTAGTCATKQTWAASGAWGTTDTMGIWGGTPSDSAAVFNTEGVGDSVVLYVDTQVVNQWKDYDYANEGVVIFVRSGPSDQYYHIFHSSESNMTGSPDSINYAILYGSTPEEGVSTRRRRILGGQ